MKYIQLTFSFLKEGCGQLKAKACARSTGLQLVQVCIGKKSVVR